MDYTEKKAIENTRTIVDTLKGVDPQLCYRFNRRLLEEARRSVVKILGETGMERWQSLSFSDRAAICTMVVRALLDEKRVQAFLSGDRKGLL